ncbi:MAG TPA: ribonuclease E/G, partial [Sphingomonadales bacterium]|nr:ribonuclease E/G [Sphingomonadales bacterium]
MSALLIEVREGGVRAARVENDEPVELHIFPKEAREGALYRARVIRIEKAADGAFLNLGGREAFLPRRRAMAPDAKSISHAVREGEMLLIELVSEAAEDGKLPLAKLVSHDVKGAPGLEKAAPEPMVKALALAAGGDEILIDNRIAGLRAEKLLPGRTKLYSDKTPLFEAFGVEEKIAEALSGAIALPGGANLAIESTKGATVVDVNGGALPPLQANL